MHVCIHTYIIAYMHTQLYCGIKWFFKAHGLPPFNTRGHHSHYSCSTPICCPSLRGFISASDSMRIERFLSRTVRLVYLPEDCSIFHDLVKVAEDRLLSAVTVNPDHVLLPLFPLSLPAALVFDRELIHFPSPFRWYEFHFSIPTPSIWIIPDNHQLDYLLLIHLLTSHPVVLPYRLYILDYSFLFS